jgi:AraC-like DNA-binding protein
VTTAGRAREHSLEISESLLRRPPELAGPAHAHDEELDFIRRYGAYRDRLRFQVSDPSNRCDTYAVSPGMAMAVVDVGCTEEFESRLSGQDIIEFHYRLSGSLLLAGSWGEICMREPSYLLWYQPPGCNDAAERMGLQDERRQTWVSLYCDQAWLRRIGGADAAALLDGLAAGEPALDTPRFQVSSQIGALLPVLRDIVRIERRDSLDWVLAVAKAHELLYASLRNAGALIADPASAPRLSVRDRHLLAHARDILAEEFIAPPGLAALARRVGMSAARLSSGFGAEFGETMSEFVRRRRFELARELLTASDLQVREVARRVGYQHHSTFTAAFTRHFGVVPKRLQRRRGTVN